MFTVLVSGGGVAGLTLAGWLRRRGVAVTVLERAPRPRTTGQAVDVRGAALTVVERMGIIDEIRQLRTRMRGMSWLDGDGTEQWRSEEFVLSSGRLDSPDLEILRDDLTSVLSRDLTRVDTARDGDATELIFGDWITALDQDADRIRVYFEHAEPRDFDLAIGADGLYSGVRKITFGPHEEHLRHMGAYLAVFGGTNRFDLHDWQVWVQDPAATYVVYPTRDNRDVRVTAGFESPQMPIDYRDQALHRRLVAERIDRIPWRADAMRATLAESDDFQFGAMAQVRMDAWTHGRVALVGDAAASPSPLTGQGTSLAIIQAYVLATELADALDAGIGHDRAFWRYESRLREFAELNQALVDGDGAAVPESDIDRVKNAIDLDATEAPA